MGQSYLFVNGIEVFKFKVKDCEFVASPICLGSISKDWLTDIKKTGFTGYVYDFKDIHKYLMKKNNIV